MVATVVGSETTLVDVNTAAVAGFVAGRTWSAADAACSVDANVVTTVMAISNTLVTVDASMSIGTKLESGLTNNWKAIRTTQIVATIIKDFMLFPARFMFDELNPKTICSVSVKSLTGTLAVIGLVATLVRFVAVDTCMRTRNSYCIAFVNVNTTTTCIAWIR